jgi:hypothetical protein
MRTYDSYIAYTAIQTLTKAQPDFDVIEWISDQDNIMLINSLGDVALFEHEKNLRGVTGHYYFRSRGKPAIQAAKEFLAEVFGLGVQSIKGLTPLTNLGARWMSRHIGFKSYGVVRTTKEPCELFIMHYTEYKE